MVDSAKHALEGMQGLCSPRTLPAVENMQELGQLGRRDLVHYASKLLRNLAEVSSCHHYVLGMIFEMLRQRIDAEARRKGDKRYAEALKEIGVSRQFAWRCRVLYLTFKDLPALCFGKVELAVLVKNRTAPPTTS